MKSTALLLLLTALSLVAAPTQTEPMALRAGPLTMTFEPENAMLRYIKLGSEEVLRGITAPVRNQFWGTVKPVVTNLVLEDGKNHFSLHFDVLCRERDIDFNWHGSIVGTENGEVAYSFDGTALTTFSRNRIGFCVLHGAGLSGKPWVIEDIHGTKTPGYFPTFISPHQPAKEIREVAHPVTTNLWAHVRMEGDTFEMEDQRNWTDASFKTYCTPLELPYPVKVEKGTKISQKISIRLEGTVPAATKQATQPARVVLTRSGHQTPLPRIGLMVSSQTNSLTPLEEQRLKALKLDHLRVDLALTNDTFREALRAAAGQAKALALPLHVGLRVGQEPKEAVGMLLPELAKLRPSISMWFLIEASPENFQEARQALKAYRNKIPIGTLHEDMNFTQLNRVRPPSEMMEVVSYGITPQIHAFDNASIMETLPIIEETVRSARQFIGSSPLVISPITLRLQTMSQAPLPGELPSNVDPRQPTAFAAAWTLGAIKYLAEAGVQSLTCHETVGWKGVMESAAGSPQPHLFPTKPDQLYPLYCLLRSLADFKDGTVESVTSSDTLAVAGLALSKDSRSRMLAANLTAHPQSVVVRGVGENISVELLDGECEAEKKTLEHRSVPSSDGSATAEVMLPPYGIAQIDRIATKPPARKPQVESVPRR